MTVTNVGKGTRSGSVNLSNNYALLNRVTADADRTITRVGMSVEQIFSDTTFRGVIYSDNAGSPDALLAQTDIWAPGTSTVPYSNSWALPLLANLSISNGTAYWVGILVLTPGGNGGYYASIDGASRSMVRWSNGGSLTPPDPAPSFSTLTDSWMFWLVTAGTDYDNIGGGRGARAGWIGISTDVSVGGGTVGDIIDGSVSDNSFWWVNASADNKGIKFNFGRPIVIDEFKWYQDNSTSHGTWELRGANVSDYSDEVAVWNGTLGGSTTQTVSGLDTSVAYRYWRLVDVAGSRSQSPFLHEIEFSLDEEPNLDVEIVVDGAGSLVLSGASDIGLSLPGGGGSSDGPGSLIVVT